MTETHKLSHPPLAAAAKHRSDLSKPDAYKTNPSGIVVGLTLNMAWQLAVVVLAPLLGGHFADVKFDSAPLWTIVGLVVAMAAMIVVVRRTLADLKTYTEDMERPKDSEVKK